MINKKTKYLSLLTSLLVLFFISNGLFAATISAQVDLNPVLLSDSFHLTYTAEGSVDDDPDFSEIKNNFDILNSGKSSNISIINGDYKRSTKWTLTLMAKQAGVFRIPPISFGKDLSPEVEITVKKSLPNSPTSNSSLTGKDFILELEASKNTSYIQEQVIITLRLLVSRSINNYQFGDINFNNTDTIVESLGKDTQYKTYRGSTPYIVVEKKVAIFPQQSGELIIRPSIAEIGIINRQSRNNFFDPFNSNTQTRRLRSNSLNLTIKDIPTTFSGKNWLPSPSIKLTEDWPHNTEFRVGEPITRTITLMADNLLASQLPKLENVIVGNLKQYPDKPGLNNNKTKTGINAIRKEKIALIPTKPGTYTLPAVDLQWWNTRENRIATAHISKREFTVLPAATTDSSQLKILQPDTNQNVTVNGAREDSNPNVTIASQNISGKWFWLTLLFSTLWIITLILWWRSRPSKKILQKSGTEEIQTLNTCLKLIKHACSRNNPQKTKSALLNWAKVVFPEKHVTNLSQLAECTDESLKNKLLTLNTCLYSANEISWQCDGIYDLCKEYKISNTKTAKHKNNTELEPFIKN